jgi:hypothetical protein
MAEVTELELSDLVETIPRGLADCQHAMLQDSYSSARRTLSLLTRLVGIRASCYTPQARDASTLDWGVPKYV